MTSTSQFYARFKGVYAIIQPGKDCSTSTLATQVEPILRGGACAIQYRNKHHHTNEITNAKLLATLCADYSAYFIINDDIALAAKVNADGVHLGQQDQPVHTARARLGRNAIIGQTCHNSVQLAQQAQTAGANYVSFGRFFPSATKPQAPPATIDTLAIAQQKIKLPVVAIGGITTENAQPLIAAGADVLALASGLISSGNSYSTTKQICSLF